jgi:DNA-binding transcriptional MerR regulator
MSGGKGQKATPNGKMTIGELARRTGMTIRNIRAHQTRGLLPPPEVHGRTGYYNQEHVARIELTREMQAEGLNLEAIRRVMEGSEGSSREMVDFARAVRAPFEDETPEIFDMDELAAAWGVEQFDPKLLARVIELGVPPQAAVETAEQLRRSSEKVARIFVELFVREIWEPFDKAGRPEEDWPKVREALDGMRPLASEGLLAMFQITMGESTEKAGERTLRDAAEPGGKRRRKRSSSRR